MKAKKLILLITIGCILMFVMVTAIYVFFFSQDTPAKIFKNTKQSDIESITAESFPDGSHGELTGEYIDEFIELMRDAEYKCSDRTDHHSGVVNFKVRFTNGVEHSIVVTGSYFDNDTLYKGFIKVDNYPYYECDTKKLLMLYFTNSNSRYKELYQKGELLNP